MIERTYHINAKVKEFYNIALIADLHSNPGKEVKRRIIDNNPDFIAIVGDYVDTSLQEWPESIKLLEFCVNIAPTFFSLGNHDYLISSEDISVMKNIGVHVMNDQWENLNDEIIIGGLTSSFYHKCEKHDPLAKMELIPELDFI